MNKWTQWSRYKALNGKVVELDDAHDAVERYIVETMRAAGFGPERQQVEGFTDQWIAYTVDAGGRRRLFLTLNAGEE